MSKTQLTKNIEKALAAYQPAKLDNIILNYRRGQYMDFEVPVTHSHIEDGLVDCVWLAEGFTNKRELKHCRYPKHLASNYVVSRERLCEINFEDVDKDTYVPCTNTACYYNSPLISQDEITPIICFEIKISKSDFHSPHGHNFVGNLNYYVMPYNLFKDLKDEIPDNIGCITYHYTSDDLVGRLRYQKKSEYVTNIDSNLYASLLRTLLDKKNKLIRKISKEASLNLSSMYDKAYSIIRQLVIEKREYISPPEEDCYKPYFNGCSNCTPVQIRCSTCPYGDVMVNNYAKKLGWENSTYDNFIL